MQEEGEGGSVCPIQIDDRRSFQIGHAHLSYMCVSSPKNSYIYESLLSPDLWIEFESVCCAVMPIYLVVMIVFQQVHNLNGKSRDTLTWSNPNSL